MSHDIVDIFRLRAALGTEGLVVASWVEDEFADEGSVLTDHADVLVGDQEVDAEAAVVGAEADVVEPAEVAEGDDPGLVDAVVADPIVSQWFGDVGSGLDAGVEGVQGCRREGRDGGAAGCSRCGRRRVGPGAPPASMLAPACRGIASGFGGSARPCRRSGGGTGWSVWRRCRGARARTQGPPCPCVTCH